MGNYTIIDESNWKRAKHCNTFRGWSQPSVYVSFELDITDFLKYVKERGWSLTLALTYASCRCANDIEAYRYRFLDDKVVLYDRIETLFTYLDDDGELFRLIYVPMCDSMEKYISQASEAVAAQKEHLPGPKAGGVFRCSALPWISFTQFSSAYSGKKDYSTPVFAWGKFFEKDGRIKLPYSIQANHAFVDGLHLGRLADKLQEFFDTCGENA